MRGEPRLERGQARIVDTDFCRERGPFVVGPARDRYPAVGQRTFVGTREHAVRDRTGRPVAVTIDDRAVGIRLEQPRRQREDARFHLREVEVDATTGAAAVVQAGGHRGGHVSRRERVGDGPERTDGGAVGPAGEVGEARECGAL